MVTCLGYMLQKAFQQVQVVEHRTSLSGYMVVSSVLEVFEELATQASFKSVLDKTGGCNTWLPWVSPFWIPMNCLSSPNSFPSNSYCKLLRVNLACSCSYVTSTKGQLYWHCGSTTVLKAHYTKIARCYLHDISRTSLVLCFISVPLAVSAPFCH